jgi:hypothetical protein
MTENMITVALIVADPGREDLQLNEGSLAAAATMIGVHRRGHPPPVGRGQAEHYVVLRHRASPSGRPRLSASAKGLDRLVSSAVGGARG